MNEYFEAARNTGLVEVIPQNGGVSGCVRIWIGPNNYHTFIPYGAMNAYWSGNCLVVTMEGGMVRSYRSYYDYEIVRY